jgi:hypothetical protein
VRIKATIVGLALAVAALTGCGGSTTHSYADVRSCLEGSGTSLVVSTDTADMDTIAEKAGEGAVVLSDDTQEIQVVVERTESDAKTTQTAYNAFAEGFTGSTDNVKRYGNVVVAYSHSPRDTDSETIEQCV